MPEPVTVAKTSEIEEGRGKCVVANGTKIALFLVDGEYFAIDDLCTHADAPLSDGWVNKKTKCVACPWHGAEFALETGQPMTPPASSPVKTYPVTVDGDDIKVEA